MIIPAIFLSLLSLSTAIGLYRESKKKIDPHYKARWLGMTFPFLYQTAVYLWVAIYDPSADLRAPWIRVGYFVIVLCATWYFTLDLKDDLLAKWRQRHG